MASVTEPTLNILEEGVRIKRTARKSTFVPRKITCLSTDSTIAISVASFNGENAKGNDASIGGLKNNSPSQVNSSKLDNYLSQTAPNIVKETSSVEPVKFVSIQEIQTARIRKMQTARKSFISDKSRFQAPESLPVSNNWVTTKNCFTLPSTSSSSYSITAPTTSRQTAPEFSRPRIRDFQFVLHNISRNAADMKIPMVTLKDQIGPVVKESYTASTSQSNTDTSRNLNKLVINNSSTKTTAGSQKNNTAATTATAVNDQVLKESKLSDISQNVKILVACQNDNVSPVKKDTNNHLLMLNYNDTVTTVNATKGISVKKNSDGDSKITSGNDQSEKLIVPTSNHVEREKCNVSEDNNVEALCFDEPGAKSQNEEKSLDEPFSQSLQENISNKRSCCEEKRPNASIVDSLTEALSETEHATFSQAKKILLCNELKSAICPPSEIGSKLLVQHLPNIDVIDDVEFLSFETEDDLDLFVKRHPSYTLDLTGKYGLPKMRGQPIKLTKTTDITKIKGWRDKIFASDGKFISIQKINRNATSKADSEISDLKDEFELSEPNSVDSRRNEDYGESCLDLDIDVYDDALDFNEVEMEDDDDDTVVSANDVLDSTLSKMDEEISNGSSHDRTPDACETSEAVDNNMPADSEKCNKSAFISDYLDDFLRNKSELKTSLNLTNTIPVSSEKISTKVVWPTEAGSPSREAMKIKPPPFQTWKPVRGNIISNLSKDLTVKSNEIEPTKFDLAKVTVTNVTTVNKNSPVVKSPKSDKPENVWKLPVINLTDAIYAANAVIPNPRSRLSTNDKINAIHYVKFIVPETKAQTLSNDVKKLKVAKVLVKPPSLSANLSPVKKVNNYLVTISRSQAEVAASALNIGADTLLCSERVISDFAKTDFSVVGLKNSVTIEPTTETEAKEMLRTKHKKAENGEPLSLSLVNSAPSVSDSNFHRVCTKPYCQLGCVCESLTVPKRKRRHCGNWLCMLDCTCKGDATKDKIPAEDPLARHKRQIRLPARFKDSFLWNGGRDLPLNIDWDMTCHRKGKMNDDPTRLLWKASSKWGIPMIRRKYNKRGVNANGIHRKNRRKLDSSFSVKTPELSHSNFTENSLVSHNTNKDLRYNSNHYSPSYLKMQEGVPASSRVESSRANLEKALNKQLDNYKPPCVLNVKREIGKWKIVHPDKTSAIPNRRKSDDKRLEEPNQMLPHDWRFITKPPEENPDLRKHSSKRESRHKLSGTQKRYEMKVGVHRLSILLKPFILKIKDKNPSVLDSKSYLVDVAHLVIKQLKKQQLELLVHKKDLMNRRAGLFKKFKSFLLDRSIDEQKSMAKDLAKRLKACCMSQISNQKNNENNASASDVRLRGNNFKMYNLGKVGPNETMDDLGFDDSSCEMELDEPRVVIENDLEDECEVNSTIVDISSERIESTNNSNNDYSLHKFTIKGNTIQPTYNRSDLLKPSLAPPIGQWRKLVPKQVAIGRSMVASPFVAPPVITPPTRSGYKPTSSHSDAVNGKIGNSNLSKEILKNSSTKYSIDIGTQLNKGATNKSSGEFKKLNTYSTEKGNKSAAPPGTRYLLYPIDPKTGIPMLPNSKMPNPIICSTPTPSKATIKGISNNGKFATILIPVNMFSEKHSGATASGSQSNLSKSGIILQPVATAAVETVPNNINDGASHSNSGEVISYAEKFRCPTSNVRLTFKTAKPASPYQSEEGKNKESFKLTSENISNIYSDEIEESCAQVSMEASNPETVSELDTVTDDKDHFQDDFCDIQADLEGIEMPKIVGFSSITEDEFRRKEDPFESFT